MEEGEFLRERALRFFEIGERLLREGVLDLAAFNFHQAAELILKYGLFKLLGDYPRTHSIKRLLWAYAEASRRDEIRRFLEENVVVIANL